MNLRQQLLPTATKERVSMILSLIREVETNIESGNPVNELIIKFNRITQRNYDHEYFQTYWNSNSIENFAKEAAQPLPQKVEDISHDELIEIVKRIRNADENTIFYLELLDRNLPHPRISNLIFWPEEEGMNEESSFEEIIEKAKSYRAIQL